MLSRLEKQSTKSSPSVASLGIQVEHECELHRQIADYCQKQGWIFFHGSMAHATKRTVGEPDYIIIASGGRVFFLEAKRKGGKLSPEQLALKFWAERLGTTVHTVYSMEETLAIFAGTAKNPPP